MKRETYRNAAKTNNNTPTESMPEVEYSADFNNDTSIRNLAKKEQEEEEGKDVWSW